MPAMAAEVTAENAPASVVVEWVNYGRRAAAALADLVASAKRDDPLATVTVVVPSNGVGVAARRLLASGDMGALSSRGKGLAAVGFVTVYRLAELLGAPTLAAGGRRPVSTPVIAASLRRALASDAGVFGPVAVHPATEEALIGAYRELRDCSMEGLGALAAMGPRAADVVRLAEVARGFLEEGFFDEEDLIDTAASVVERYPNVLEPFGTIVVYLPERLTRHGARLLAAIGEQAGLTVLAGTTGDDLADGEVVVSLTRLVGTVPARPERAGELGDLVSPDRTRIVTASDPDDEVRAAVRHVTDAVRAGTRLDRIAVLYSTSEPYARLLHDQLGAAGIPYNGSAVLTPAGRIAGRTLLGLLELPDRGFRREDVFAWLAGAAMRHDGRRAPVTAWERISRDAGVVWGADQWDQLVGHYAEEADAEAERTEADPDAPPWKAEQLHRNADHARSLRGFVLGWVAELADADVPLPWSERADWARGLLHRLLGTERARAAWPPDEQRAAERVERALDRLGCLDEIEAQAGLDVFVRTLQLELDADLGRVGRMGEGVLVGSVTMGVGQDLDLLLVLGLVEGAFPSPVREDSLLPDNERAAAGDDLVRRAELTERQHRQLLASLAGAPTQVLCLPRGDLRRSAERVPSRWVLDVASVLAGARLWTEGLLNGDARWLSHSPSYDAGIRSLSDPATDQEYRLRALMAAGGGAGTTPAIDDAVLAAGASMTAARRSELFTRFDGNLAGLAVPSPVDRTVSATALEGWSVCPFAYLAQRVLGVDEVERPEDRLKISPLDWGSLVHEVLERFIAEVLERPPERRPRPADGWGEADIARIRAIAEDVCHAYEERGLVGRPLFWREDKRQLDGLLVRFLREDSEHRAGHGTSPIAAELPFGMPAGRVGTVAMPLPDGRQLEFRGKADRVDETAEGALEVLDYKTGRADRFTKLSEVDPDLGGKKLQLPVYGLAARAFVGRPGAEVLSTYWFTSNRGGFKRVDLRVTKEVLAEVSQTLGRVVAGIEEGVFPPAPSETSTATRVECAYCDPDRLGVVDLLRQMERKHRDPAMARYLMLDGSVEDVSPEGVLVSDE